MLQPDAEALDRIQRRKSLGLQIRFLRVESAMTATRLSELAGLSRTHLSRIENGWVAPSASTVKAISDALGLEKARTRALLHEATLSAATEPVGLYDSKTHQSQEALLTLERSATRIRCSCSAFLPALLQTVDYGRAILQTFTSTFPEVLQYDLDHEVLLRARRTAETADIEKRFEFLIHASRLSVSPADGVDMRSQLAAVASVARRQNVSIRVRPEVTTQVVDMTLIDDTALSHDVPTGYVINTDPEEIAIYESFWESLCEAALDEQESLEVIERHIRKIDDADRAIVLN